MYAVQTDGRDIRTIESFDDDPIMSELREAFTREHALQCGFCTPGMLVAARDIVIRLGDPGEQRVREELAGNLCRCTGYVGIVRAIREVGAGMAKRGIPTAPVQSGAGPRSITVSDQLTLDAFATVTASAGQGKVLAGAAKRASHTARPEISGGIEVRQHVNVPHDASAVWDMLGDVRAVAEMLPGAELISSDAEGLTGRVHMKIGPIKSLFSGRAIYERDDGARTGTVSGEGQDSLSGSRVAAKLEFSVTTPEMNISRLSISLTYSLKGPLAQFSRSSVAEEFVRRLLQTFALNLTSRLSGSGTTEVVPSVTELHLGRIALSTLAATIRRWFRRRRPD
ncbi:2Fe-2S iron-sulfur cluster-binding protein [uncultured Enterovirga sp.]|uniref:2Fe-2S iron-sulfur cluster-binding protein n=1 Tax=uncultured Enterovirga sp. TaxID=2026352 RepID=UPI0035CADE58